MIAGPVRGMNRYPLYRNVIRLSTSILSFYHVSLSRFSESLTKNTYGFAQPDDPVCDHWVALVIVNIGLRAMMKLRIILLVASEPITLGKNPLASRLMESSEQSTANYHRSTNSFWLAYGPLTNNVSKMFTIAPQTW